MYQQIKRHPHEIFRLAGIIYRQSEHRMPALEQFIKSMRTAFEPALPV